MTLPYWLELGLQIAFTMSVWGLVVLFGPRKLRAWVFPWLRDK